MTNVLRQHLSNSKHSRRDSFLYSSPIHYKCCCSANSGPAKFCKSIQTKLKGHHRIFSSSHINLWQSIIKKKYRKCIKSPLVDYLRPFLQADSRILIYSSSINVNTVADSLEIRSRWRLSSLYKQHTGKSFCIHAKFRESSWFVWPSSRCCSAIIIWKWYYINI